MRTNKNDKKVIIGIILLWIILKFIPLLCCFSSNGTILYEKSSTNYAWGFHYSSVIILNDGTIQRVSIIETSDDPNRITDRTKKEEVIEANVSETLGKVPTIPLIAAKYLFLTASNTTIYKKPLWLALDANEDKITYWGPLKNSILYCNDYYSDQIVPIDKKDYIATMILDFFINNAKQINK